jgi:hypothetical protein
MTCHRAVIRDKHVVQAVIAQGPSPDTHAAPKHKQAMADKGGQAAGSLTAAALRCRACAGPCCCARHTTTLRARHWALDAVQGAVNAVWLSVVCIVGALRACGARHCDRGHV